MGGDIGLPVFFKGEARGPRALRFIQHPGQRRPLFGDDAPQIQRLNRNVHVRQETPSFFCRLVDEVVYWNSSFFSG